jgi:hypothetical protein
MVVQNTAKINTNQRIILAKPRHAATGVGCGGPEIIVCKHCKLYTAWATTRDVPERIVRFTRICHIRIYIRIERMSC